MLNRSNEDWKRILGHQAATWHNIEQQRDPQFRITHKIETDPVKIHDAMSEEANEK